MQRCASRSFTTPSRTFNIVDACEGVISYGEISPAPTGAAEPVTVEILSEWLTKPPANDAARERAKAALGPLRAKVLAEMAGFVAALAMK